MLSRERNAFLFGEVTSEGVKDNPLSADEIFGLKPLPREPGVVAGPQEKRLITKSRRGCSD